MFELRSPRRSLSVVSPAARTDLLLCSAAEDRETDRVWELRFFIIIQEATAVGDERERPQEQQQTGRAAAVLRRSSRPPLSASPVSEPVSSILYFPPRKRRREEEEEERPLPSRPAERSGKTERESERVFYSSLVLLRSSLGSERLAHVRQLRKILFPRKVSRLSTSSPHLPVCPPSHARLSLSLSVSSCCVFVFA